MAVNYINYDEKRRKIVHPINTRAEYLALRDTEAQKQNVAEARKGDAKAKRKLAQFNYNLTSANQEDFPLRGAATIGNSVGMDVDFDTTDADYEEKMKQVPELVLSKKEELGLLMLERSATKGYHLVFKRHKEMTNEENLQWASDLLGIQFDKGAKDSTRVFFATTANPDDLLYLSDKIFSREIVAMPEGSGGTGPALPVLSASPETGSTGPVPPLPSYLGIPYTDIISKYWEMYYQGKTPVKSNRDTLTFELANVLKHICGFDRNVLDQVIPCYDEFPEEEKLKCIDSALSGKRTQMPKRLRDVLTVLRRNQLVTDPNEAKDHSFEEMMEEDELFYYKRIPKEVLIQGIKDSIDAAGHTLSMPVFVAICPAIGARATSVQLVVHGKANHLNLIGFVVGEFASGKGQMDDVVQAWMSEDIVMADLYNKQWEEWKEKYLVARNKKELPPEPKLPKVWITLNNTTANLAELLSNVQGRHAFSFTPEADVVSTKWKTSVSDFSTMLRVSYDGSPYDREARSVDAVSVHLTHLLWNVVMCGTGDSLYRVVNNYTDGFQSRIAVARTPDNTYSPLDENPAHMTDLQRDRIAQVSHLLPLLSGTLELPKLEEKGREWLEEIRIEAMKNGDDIMARQRFRVCVTAQRMTCCLMLAGMCAKLIKAHGVTSAEKMLRQDPNLWFNLIEKMQTPAFLELFDIIADSLIDNNMYFFRRLIGQAQNSTKYLGGDNSSLGNRHRKGKNDTIYSRLPQEFSYKEATNLSLTVKGCDTTSNSVSKMLGNWEKQGLISLTSEGNYRKNYN